MCSALLEWELRVAVLLLRLSVKVYSAAWGSGIEKAEGKGRKSRTVQGLPRQSERCCCICLCPFFALSVGLSHCSSVGSGGEFALQERAV